MSSRSPLGAAKVKRRRRGDKHHRHKAVPACLLKSGWRKTLPLPTTSWRLWDYLYLFLACYIFGEIQLMCRHLPLHIIPPPQRSEAIVRFVSSSTHTDAARNAYTLMAVSSSRMLPSLYDRTSSILSSISFSSFLFSAPWTISAFFSSSSSGLSHLTTMPRSWSARPSGVIMKFSSVTLTAVSGR